MSVGSEAETLPTVSAEDERMLLALLANEFPTLESDELREIYDSLVYTYLILSAFKVVSPVVIPPTVISTKRA